MRTATGRTFKIDDDQMYFEERGEGEALLLLHGHTGTGGDWRHVFDLDALGERRRLVVPDARAHGRSTDRHRRFGFRRAALDVLALLDFLGVERADVIGMSLGAKTMLHAATLAPARFGRLVLVSATPRFPEATRALFRAFASAPRSNEEWAAMRALHVQGDEQIASLWKHPAKFADDPDDMSFTAGHLRTITAETLLVAGDRDPLYPVELAVELYRGIPTSSLWVVPGGGHGPIFGAEREEFVKRALTFLGIEAPASRSL